MTMKSAKAAVLRPCYRSLVVKAKKGKGSYKRRAKHARSRARD